MTLHELQRRLHSFNIREEAQDVIRETADELKRLNQEQLKVGIDAIGEPLYNLKYDHANYVFSYAQRRAKRGLQIDHYDLKFTGKFWESIRVDVNSEKFELVSDDPKAGDILEMFARPIGLTRNSKDIYREETFMPGLREKIERKLGIKFN